MYNGIHVSTEHCINLCLFYLICYRYKKNCFELKCFVCSCKIRWTWSTICYTVQSNRWPIQLQSRVGNVAIQECRQQAMVISRSCLLCCNGDILWHAWRASPWSRLYSGQCLFDRDSTLKKCKSVLQIVQFSLRIGSLQDKFSLQRVDWVWWKAGKRG